LKKHKVNFFADKLPLPIEKNMREDSEKIIFDDLDYTNFITKKGFYQR